MRAGTGEWYLSDGSLLSASWFQRRQLATPSSWSQAGPSGHSGCTQACPEQSLQQWSRETVGGRPNHLCLDNLADHSSVNHHTAEVTGDLLTRCVVLCDFDGVERSCESWTVGEDTNPLSCNLWRCVSAEQSSSIQRFNHMIHHCVNSPSWNTLS